MKTNDTITTYKGFDEKLCCNPDNKSFQYEIGKEYEMDGNPVKCKNGFHSCENPLDVFIYYAPGESRYAQTEVYGKIDRDTIDSKIASSKIKIKVEIGLRQIIEDGIKFIFKKTNWSKENSTNQDSSGARATGNSSGAQATGYSSGAQATGDSSGAQATGNSSMACVNGQESKAEITGDKPGFACGFGIQNKAKGTLNSWLVLSEWVEKNGEWMLKSVKSVKVDGKKIEADISYVLINGKFIKE